MNFNPTHYPMHHLLEPQSDVLTNWLAERGEPAYRAAQIHRWLFAGRAQSIGDMTDLPARLREALLRAFPALDHGSAAP